MDRTIQLISIRDPDGFNNIEVAKSAYRDIFRIADDGHIEYVTPEVTTLDEFRERLAAVGEVTRFETYISEKTFAEVTRGSIKFDAGVEHYFQIEYDVLYKSMVDGVVSCAEYTKGSL